MFSSPLNIKPWSIVGKGFYSPLVFRKLASVWFVFFILNCFFFRGFEFLSIAGNLELSQKGVTWFFLSFNIGFSILLAFSFSNLSFLYGKEVIDFFFWVFFILYVWGLVPFINSIPVFLLVFEFLTFLIVGFLSWALGFSNSGSTLVTNFKTNSALHFNTGLKVLVFFLWSSAFSTLFFFWSLGLLGPEVGFLDKGLSAFVFNALVKNPEIFSSYQVLGVFCSLAVLLKLMISPFQFFLISFYEVLPPLAWVFYLSFYYNFFLIHASLFLFFFIPLFFKKIIYLVSSILLVTVFILWGSFRFSLDIRFFFALSTLAYFSLIFLSLGVII